MTEAAMDVDGGDAPQRQKASAVDANDAKKNQMWVEKYRPSKLSDVAAHKDIIDTIGRLTSQDRLPHLLLYGPPGTGKTSTILAVAKELYGPQFSQMTLELNASDGASLIPPFQKNNHRSPTASGCLNLSPVTLTRSRPESSDAQIAASTL